MVKGNSHSILTAWIGLRRGRGRCREPYGFNTLKLVLIITYVLKYHITVKIPLRNDAVWKLHSFVNNSGQRN